MACWITGFLSLDSASTQKLFFFNQTGPWTHSHFYTLCLLKQSKESNVAVRFQCHLRFLLWSFLKPMIWKWSQYALDSSIPSRGVIKSYFSKHFLHAKSLCIFWLQTRWNYLLIKSKSSLAVPLKPFVSEDKKNNLTRGALIDFYINMH